MSFSVEWESIYEANQQMSIWPWSDLVSYVMRYARPKKPEVCNVLELGCGAGANIEFFKWLGVNYFALEGSPTMVLMLKEKFPEFSKGIQVGDFTKTIPFLERFDIVVDRASLTHNDTKSIQRSLKIIYEKMKPGASFVGIDWFSTNHSDFQRGTKLKDGFTCSDFNRGQFKDVGLVHFSNKSHILELFKDFKIKTLEEKIVSKSIPSANHIFASWNLHAIKE